MGIRQRDALKHTYAEYLTWPESGGEELIDGIAYVREPPAPSPSHQEVVAELCHQLRVALEGKPYRHYIAPFDVRLPKGGEADELIDTVVQPDVLIIGDLSKLDARGMHGAPDWIAEVLSPTTASHDLVVKLPIYERAGVLEVWLIHPIDQMLTIYRLEGGRYGRATIQELKGTTAISAIPGVNIDWDRLRATPRAEWS
ncbi:MAG: Uma2 family endonuclease [Steroidobacteraceae bacterium]